MGRKLKRLVVLAAVVMSFPLWSPVVDDLMDDIQYSATNYLKYDLKVLPLSQREASMIDVSAEEPLRVGGIEIGDNREQVEYIHQQQAESVNEYGLNWTTYHQGYGNFMMVMYDESNAVRGLFSNQDIFQLPYGIQTGTKQEEVRELLGEPLEFIEKGNTHYIIDNEEAYDVYLLNNQFVTVFYDTYQNNTVEAAQIIDYDTEMNFDSLYSEGNLDFSYALEEQLFDLTNATRLKFDLPLLEWSQEAADTAYNHSQDMAVNQYFDHVNLEGQTPFDRMTEDGIEFLIAAENLAFGQKSSIYAHQGLMNSRGHRVNILQEDVTRLGTGVTFDTENQPYYTEIFYSNIMW